MSAILVKPSLGITARLQASLMFTSSSILPTAPVGKCREGRVLKGGKSKSLNWTSSSYFPSVAQFWEISLSFSGPGGAFWSSFKESGRRETLRLGKPSLSLIQKRGMIMASQGTLPVSNKDQVPLLRNMLAGMVKPYLKKNPTASAALELIRKHDQGPICYDHFAFRTFGENMDMVCVVALSCKNERRINNLSAICSSDGVYPWKCNENSMLTSPDPSFFFVEQTEGCGIDALAQVFLDMGYSKRDELRFPGKKLRALWFSPPENAYDVEGELENGPLPRIFISEILVDQLSEESQQVIYKYTNIGVPLAKHAPLASSLDTLTWPTPSLFDYQQLASESEYAAWTLVHGYALNHATVSVHRLRKMRGLDQLNQFLQDQRIKLNSVGGILKVSPDGGLQQSASLADSVEYAFADGEVRRVPASYIEFAQRLVLPVYSYLKDDEIFERHRRDGFEVGNADKIFESTSLGQTGAQRV